MVCRQRCSRTTVLGFTSLECRGFLGDGVCVWVFLSWFIHFTLDVFSIVGISSQAKDMRFLGFCLVQEFDKVCICIFLNMLILHSVGKVGVFLGFFGITCFGE